MTEVRSSPAAMQPDMPLYEQVRGWLTGARMRFGLAEVRLETQDLPTSKLSGWYETPDYVIDIAAWEQAYCLGIMVWDKRSDVVIYAVGGRCDSEQEVTDRLDAFARWLRAHQPMPGLHAEPPIYAAMTA